MNGSLGRVGMRESPPRASMLGEVTTHIRRNLSEINELTGQIEGIADRLMGHVPSGHELTSGPSTVDPSSSIEILMGVAAHQESAINRMREQIQRMELL